VGVAEERRGLWHPCRRGSRPSSARHRRGRFRGAELHRVGIRVRRWCRVPCAVRDGGWRRAGCTPRWCSVWVDGRRDLLTRSNSNTGPSRPSVWMQKKRRAHTATLTLDGACFLCSRMRPRRGGLTPSETPIDRLACRGATVHGIRVRANRDGRLHLAVLRYRVCAVSFNSKLELTIALPRFARARPSSLRSGAPL